jgi:hypothetical protein
MVHLGVDGKQAAVGLQESYQMFAIRIGTIGRAVCPSLSKLWVGPAKLLAMCRIRSWYKSPRAINWSTCVAFPSIEIAVPKPSHPIK